MADAPPSYQSAQGHEHREQDAESKTSHRFHIRHEHVAAVVATVVPIIRDRARHGLANSTLLLFPSDQSEPNRGVVKSHGLTPTPVDTRKGNLVGYYGKGPPVLVQLEGDYDTGEFWCQPEALDMLQAQVLAAISDTVPARADDTPPPSKEMLPGKNSFFGRKLSRALNINAAGAPVKAPVAVKAYLDYVFFRMENKHGLYQTFTGQAVFLAVEVS
ncbi:hypothetical protein LTR91_004798 [Friedmanniomyces endolithicus]|uniref:Uncharacterized protein n=2 Tax=Friedmanniomyces endolithicus TaxID=329885 RepID=A0AAN6KUV9_9PEZI|nr:hypothetical protein LTS00_013111 [Friedmanniomyces endolithicus]KAK0929919.1 hypothetical protein LTR57_001777 [Friedmanniomyces endolithicus]KAK1003007.1 hypothetical protein LTR91_004798 [Friedmanniomyces endolithicus]KAK1019277.1 hypothetical protein LTR54_001092 [Friedmanniomyces endolithicus]KAK1053504.1 hypothetical protein LTS16_001262 [Friedmanniomyces endolithicus]